MILKIPIKQKITILGVGFLASLLLLLIIYVMFAQVIVDFLINSIDNQIILSLIILGLLMLSFVISLIVGFLITDDIRKTSILKASIMSFLVNFIIILVISYVSLIIFYPNVFSEVSGLEIILIFPQVIIYFSIYILIHPFYLFIISSFVYFIIFIIFLEIYYESKALRKKEYEPSYRR